MNDGYVLDGVHVDIGCLPVDNCAPGQYVYGKDGLGGVSTYQTGGIAVPTCSTSDLYIIVHAAVNGKCPL